MKKGTFYFFVRRQNMPDGHRLLPGHPPLWSAAALTPLWLSVGEGKAASLPPHSKRLPRFRAALTNMAPGSIGNVQDSRGTVAQPPSAVLLDTVARSRTPPSKKRLGVPRILSLWEAHPPEMGIVRMFTGLRIPCSAAVLLANHVTPARDATLRSRVLGRRHWW